MSTRTTIQDKFQPQPELMMIYRFKETENSFKDQNHKQFVWSDIDERFTVTHHDIELDYNLSAVKNALDNILRIPKYTIPSRPDFGVNLERFLGEPIDDILKEEMMDDIRWAIETFEPRVKIIDITFDETMKTENVLLFNIVFKIISDKNDDKSYEFPVRIEEKDRS